MLTLEGNLLLQRTIHSCRKLVRVLQVATRKHRRSLAWHLVVTSLVEGALFARRQSNFDPFDGGICR